VNHFSQITGQNLFFSNNSLIYSFIHSFMVGLAQPEYACLPYWGALGQRGERREGDGRERERDREREGKGEKDGERMSRKEREREKERREN